MKTALITSATALALVLSACGGSDAPNQKDFDHGANAPAPPATETPSAKVVAYPSGPYGTGLGSTVQNMAFMGWLTPLDVGFDTTQLVRVNLSDYYNPDGTKPIKAIWLNSSAVWCSACQAEYGGAIGICENSYTSCVSNSPDCGGKTCVKKSMAAHYDEYKDKGVVFIGTIFEDGKNPPGPAQPKDLEFWGNKYEVNFPLVLDPDHKMAGYFTSDAVPMSIVVDTKTMKITAQVLGGDPGGVLKAIDAILAGS